MAAQSSTQGGGSNPQAAATAAESPQGSAGAGGPDLVAQVVAYELLEIAARDVVTAVKVKIDEVRAAQKGMIPRILIVTDRALVATDWSFAAVGQQLSYFSAALDDANARLSAVPEREMQPESLAAGVGLGDVGDLLTGVSGILTAITTNYSTASNEIALGSTPLVAAVASELLGNAIPVVVDQFSLLKPDKSPVFREFAKAQASCLALRRMVSEHRTKTVEPADRAAKALEAAQDAYYKALATLQQGGQAPSTGVLETKMEELRSNIQKAAETRALVAYAEGLISQFDSFATSITSAPKEGVYPALVAAALHEALHAASADQQGRITHVLYVGVEGCAGQTVKRTLLLWGHADFMGGEEVSYLLLDCLNNEIVAVDTVTLLATLPMNLRKGTLDPAYEIALQIKQQTRATPTPAPAS